MTRQEIIKQLKNYFAPHELVGQKTFRLFGDDSFQVFDTDTLHCLLIMRKEINLPFEINNWFWGGVYDERGFRSNIQSIVLKKTTQRKLYLSGHVMGKAFDFKAKGMSSVNVRKWIVDNQDKFPCKIRLENKKNGIPISWVHFDTKWIESKPKIYLFDI